MLYVHVSCFVVRACAVSRRYIYVCNCDVFSVVNVYLDHFKVLRECNGERLTTMQEWRMDEGVVVVSAGLVGGTRGSGIMSSVTDVLWMSVVRGMSGVGGVCEMFICLARGGVGGEVGGEWNRGSIGRVSVFWLRWCGWCMWGVGRGLGPGSGGVGWCYVCVSCESGFSV